MKKTFLIALMASGTSVFILGLFLLAARIMGFTYEGATMVGGMVVLLLATWFLSKEKRKESLHPSKREKEKFKLRETARNYGTLSGILAGFCVAFITFFIASIPINEGSKLIGEFVAIFFVAAAFLFIVAAERYFLSIRYEDVEKYDLACNLYNGGIISMLIGLLLMTITFGLFWASMAAGIVLAIEIYLVVRAYR